MNKKKIWGRIVCAVVFAFICAATLAFLHSFSVFDDRIYSVVWDTEEAVGNNGTRAIEYDDSGMPLQLEDGEYFRFTGTIPDITSDAELVCDVLWSDITLIVDGDTLFSSKSSPQSDLIGQAQLTLPLQTDSAGKAIELIYVPIGEGNMIFPPLLRIKSSMATQASNIAYANYYGIPAGAYGLVFVILCGLILLGFITKKPDLSLILLALATGALTVYDISAGFGYYFLDKGLQSVLTSSAFEIIPSVSMLVYILINSRRGHLKLFGIITAFSATAIAAAYLVSLVSGSYLSSYINDMLNTLFTTGYYHSVLYWLTMYLVFACSAVAIFDTVRSFIKIRSEADALLLKNKIILDSFHASEQRLRETSKLRHEFRNHITALHLMYKNGDLSELEKTFSELDGRQSAILQTQFTDNFVINCLLQSASVKAADNNIRFDAHVNAPEKLGIGSDDLCVFIMNMLDNATEACMRLDDTSKRYIKFRAELRNGYLAISCVNSFDGKTNENSKGELKTTKTESRLHGFGLREMRRIAEKYDSVLNISYSKDTFTAETALKNR